MIGWSTTGLILMLHILLNPIKLHPKDLVIECIPIQFHHTVLLVLFFIITSVWRQRSLFVFDDGNQFGWKDIFLDVEYRLPCWKSYTYQFQSRPSSIYKAQSRKQNRCPLSLGGNITEVFVNDSFRIIARFAAQNSFGRISPGKMGQGNPYQRFRETKLKSSGNNSKGIVNKGLGYVSPNFPPMDNGQWSHALIPCLVVSFMWLRP